MQNQGRDAETLTGRMISSNEKYTTQPQSAPFLTPVQQTALSQTPEVTQLHSSKRVKFQPWNEKARTMTASQVHEVHPQRSAR